MIASKRRFLVSSAAIGVVSLLFGATGCSSELEEEPEEAESSEQAQSTFTDPANCVPRAAQQLSCSFPYERNIWGVIAYAGSATACASFVVSATAVVAGTATIVLTPAAVAGAAATTVAAAECVSLIRDQANSCTTVTMGANDSLCQAWCPWQGRRVIGSTCYCPMRNGACDAPNGTPAPPTPGYRTTCDNGVAPNQCAYTGAGIFKCVNPNGNSSGTGGTGGDMWRKCNSGGCAACSVATPQPAPTPGGCTQLNWSDGCASCAVSNGRAACSGSSSPANTSSPPYWNLEGTKRYKCTSSGWRACLN